MTGALRLLTVAALGIGVSSASVHPGALLGEGARSPGAAAQSTNAPIDRLAAKHVKRASPHLGATGKRGRRTSAPPHLGTTGRKHGSGLDWGVGSGAGSVGKRGRSRK